MEEVIRSLVKYSPNSQKYKIHKISTLLNAREFYKRRKMTNIAFENGIFPIPRQYQSGMDGLKEDELDLSEFMPEEK